MTDLAGDVSRPLSLSPRRDRREQSLEVLYWLAVLKGKAHTLAEDTVVNTDTIPAGYLVVKAQWLQARATRVRGQASLLHAARGRDAHHRESHGAAGGLALLARAALRTAS